MIDKEVLEKIAQQSTDITDVVNKATEPFSKFTIELRSITSPITTLSKDIQKIFTNYNNQINNIAISFAHVSSLFQDAYKRINEWKKFFDEDILKIFSKYHYFVSTDTPIEIINHIYFTYLKNPKRSTIENEFYKFYQTDDWKILDFYKKWEGNKFLEKRILSIKDVVMYVRSTKKPSPRLVLPVIISQIDGILLDIAKDNDITITKKDKNKKYKNKNQSEIHKEVFNLLENSNEIQANIALNIVSSILFQTTYIGNKPKKGSYNFSRHKIMHGEDMKGLTNANMIRAFLLLDFLAQFLISNEEEKTRPRQL